MVLEIWRRRRNRQTMGSSNLKQINFSWRDRETVKKKNQRDGGFMDLKSCNLKLNVAQNQTCTKTDEDTKVMHGFANKFHFFVHATCRNSRVKFHFYFLQASFITLLMPHVETEESNFFFIFCKHVSLLCSCGKTIKAQ
jgi:hypothetical protein